MHSFDHFCQINALDCSASFGPVEPLRSLLREWTPSLDDRARGDARSGILPTGLCGPTPGLGPGATPGEAPASATRGSSARGRGGVEKGAARAAIGRMVHGLGGASLPHSVSGVCACARVWCACVCGLSCPGRIVRIPQRIRTPAAERTRDSRHPRIASRQPPSPPPKLRDRQPPAAAVPAVQAQAISPPCG